MVAMRLLFVADGRSPIALNWIRHFVERRDEVHLVSTYASRPDLALAGLEFLPLAFSSMKKQGPPAAVRSGGGSGLLSARALGLRTVLRQWLGPLTIRRAAGTLRSIIRRIRPDLIHALRIPYEGMVAAEAYTPGIPLIVSVWGNDFTLHGPSTPLMRHYTQWTVSVADALHADCRRDIRLARGWGLGPDKPTLVTPGNGGIRMDVFHPRRPSTTDINRAVSGLMCNTYSSEPPRVLEHQPERALLRRMAGDHTSFDGSKAGD
jgi:hypothetical protein